MKTVWITALTLAVLTVARCGAQQDLYILAPCSPVNKNFPFPGNCNRYLTCAPWGLLPMDCPSILYFDEVSGRCEWPYIARRCLETSPRTPCNPNPCVNGTCELTSSSKLGYQCVCHPGFTGPFCSTDIDECASLPMLCERGNCLNLHGSFHCDCGNTGFTGQFCEIPPDEKPCINGQPCVNGKCQFGPNSNFCVCSSGYEGLLCNSAVFGACESRPCSNGGRCSVGPAGGYICNCTSTGYTGAMCTTAIDPCQSSPCSNGGKCLRSGAEGFTCNCTGTGFGGATCTTDFCNPNPCPHGHCVSGSSGFNCNCRGSGYEGVFCDVPVQGNSTCMSNNPCVRGTCVHLASGDFCDCQGTGYTGPTCTIPVGTTYCYTGACSNGACVSGQKGYVCNCTGTVYTGPRCDMTACDYLEYNPCMNGATCVPQLHETYTCLCAPGFTGGNCETLEIPANCPTHQCPVNVPRYNYPDWNDPNCVSYYNCQSGTLQQRWCPAGQRFDVITMVCKQLTDPQAIFCEYFRN